ncbi:MFS transporter [Mucilaginibacter sp. 44-25]|uniref:MFS transporter n=1 Tax=Mucilaginibacter sp. 44-25 TaxID=1895794 RepID=UPI000966C03A|nr:MFS transporter [Mucilaginibacter sp. 44-25]OJW12798.1 MAG: MFS transporter [Mucilaginibacter sp. 44-25]
MPSLIQLYKKAYSGLARYNWYLSIVMLINRSGTMVVPFMTIYCINQLHFTVAQAGYIMALFGAGSIVGAYVGGWLSDRIGFYDMQAVTLLTGGVMFIIVGYQTTFISLGIATFILSFCNEAFRPANAMAVAHFSAPENKTRSYSLHRLATNLGWAVGAALGGLLASFNFHLLFWVDGCTNIFAALALMALIPRANVSKPVKPRSDELKPASAYKDKVYLIFIILITFFNLCFFQFFVMEPVFLKVQWHFNTKLIGLLLASNGIIIALVELVMINYLEGRRHMLQYIIYGILVTGGGFTLLNILPPHPASGVLVVGIITFGEMVSMPFMNSFWISRSGERNRGQYAALYTMSWSAAQVLAPILGGQIILWGSFTLLWYSLGGICLLVAVALYLLYRLNYNNNKLGAALNERLIT